MSGAESDPPVFALVRGVLYALDPVNGSLRWARRVGIDTVQLPLWLPATSVTPPLALVASSEPPGLLALHSNDGSPQWCQVLDEMCAGQPPFAGSSALGILKQIEEGDNEFVFETLLELIDSESSRCFTDVSGG